MKRLIILVFLLGPLGLCPAYALRCGHDLISIGDHYTEVRHKCGDPISIDQRMEYLVTGDPYLRFPEPYWTASPPLGVITPITVQVEEWVYNFGPHRFMQLLRFENGILRNIKSLDKGY